MLIASAFVLGAGFLFRFWATSNPYLLALINNTKRKWKCNASGIKVKRLWLLLTLILIVYQYLFSY